MHFNHLLDKRHEVGKAVLMPRTHTALQEDKELEGMLADAAKANSDVKFVLASADKAARAMDYFGINEKDVPAFVIDKAGAKYIKRNVRASEVPEYVAEFKVKKVYRLGASGVWDRPACCFGACMRWW